MRTKSLLQFSACLLCTPALIPLCSLCLRIMHDFESLSKMMSRYHEFDVGGKRIYLEKWDELVERLQIFNTRAKLSDDPMVKEYLTSLSRQLLFMSTNLDSVYQGRGNGEGQGCLHAELASHCRNGVVATLKNG